MDMSNNKVMLQSCIFSFDNTVKQNFDFPSPLIRYICMNPIPSSKFILKLYYCCKYFYFKMKIILVDHTTYHLQYKKKEFELEWKKKKVEFAENDFHKFDFKFFCEEGTDITCGIHPRKDPLIFSYMLNKQIWYFNSCHFWLRNQDLTLKEYQIVANVATGLSLEDLKIFKPDGKSILAVDEILGMAGGNLKQFNYRECNKSFNVINKETAKGLSKLTLSAKLRYFYLENVPADFDASLFSTFVKNNFGKNGICSIRFRHGIDTPTPAQFETFKTIFFNSVWGSEEFKELELYVPEEFIRAIF